MRKTLAATIATLALTLGIMPAATADDTPTGPAPVGTITEPLDHPQWKTDSDNYGDSDSCENPGLTYPQGCVVFPDFGFNSMRYVLHYVARLYEVTAAQQNTIAAQADQLERKQARINRLRAKLAATR